MAPVLVFSEDPPEEIRKKYLVHGVQVPPAINYERGLFNYYRKLGKIIRNYSVTTVYIAFFNYYSFVPLMARRQGVRHIVHHEKE